MYKKVIHKRTQLKVNTSREGVTLPTRIERMMKNKEDVPNERPLIYTEAKDGVLPNYNIKADKFEIALEAMDRTERATLAQGENKPKMEVVKDDSGSESKGEVVG